MSRYVYYKFFHLWKWKDSVGREPPLSVTDYISAQVALRTNRTFYYQGTRAFASRSSESTYQRGGNVSIQAVDPITITLIAAGIAAVIGILYQALKGAPISTGIDMFGVKWYASTEGHKVRGDDNNPDNEVNIPEQPIDGGEGILSSSSNIWLIGSVIAGLFLLFLVVRK